jgi:hypothetical protein
MSMEEFRASVKSEAPRTIEQPGKIYLYGKYIFLNEVNKGVHLIDNSNPAAPNKFAFVNIPGNVDIAVKGNVLYADSYTDLVALDISDPHAVKEVERVQYVFPQRLYEYGVQVDVSGDRVIVDFLVRDTTVKMPCQSPGRSDVLYLASSNAAMVQSFAGSPAKSSVSMALGKGGSMARFALMNNYLYTIDQSAMQVFEVTNAAQPIPRNRVTMQWGIETIFPYKNNLFIGAPNGMFIYDASNPAYPVSKGTFQHLRSCDPVVVEDDIAYVTLRGGVPCGGQLNQLDVLDIKDLTAPRLIRSYPMSSPYGLGIDGGKLFVCEGAFGLKFLDAQSPANIFTSKWVEGVEAFDVIPDNNVLIVTAKDGLYQYNYSNLQSPQLLSKLTISRKQ